MFDWLFEGRTTVYVLLGGAALLLLLLWWRDRKRHWIAAIGVCVALAGVYFLLDRLVETEREQITRKLNEMAAAVKVKNTDAIFRNISDQFHFKTLDKAQFRKGVDGVMRLGWVDELLVWDIEVPPLKPGQVNTVDLQAKPIGSANPNRIQFIVKSQWVRDPDGQWRLKGFEVFDPINNQTVEVPQLPQ